MRAEKEINLIPTKGWFNYKSPVIFTALSAGVIILLAVLLFIYFFPQIRIHNLKAENAMILKQIDSMGDINDVMHIYEKKQADYLKMKEAIDAIEKEKIDVLGFLKNLSSYIPENVFISSLSLENGETLNVSFVVSNPVDTAKLIVKLKQMDAFENIELNNVSIAKGESSISFSLKIKGNILHPSKNNDG